MSNFQAILLGSDQGKKFTPKNFIVWLRDIV